MSTTHPATRTAPAEAPEQPAYRPAPDSFVDRIPGRVGRAAVGAREAVRTRTHWGIGHGLPSVMMRIGARAGDLQAQMVTQGQDPAQAVDIVERMRAQDPVLRSGLGWVVTGHAEARAVLTGEDFRSGFPGQGGRLGKIASWAEPVAFNPVIAPSLLVTEPPHHTRYRKLVTRVFTMRATEKLRDRTQQITDELLDDLAAGGGRPQDVVDAYCAALPVTVIAEILGVPARDRGLILEFGAAAAPSLDLGLGWRRYRTVQRALNDFDAWLTDHLDHLRRHPGDNLLSQLVAVTDDGRGLDLRELKATAGLVLAAGFETTVNLLGNGIALIAEHPEQRDALLAGTASWANAAEEVLRFDPPVMLTGRIAARDTEVAGHPVSSGQMVATILLGANRDPRVFTDPHTFDVTRENAGAHLTFSAGRHHCLGAALARMEGEVGLRSIFERYPDLQLAPGAVRRQTRILRGYDHLPVVLAPAGR